MKEETNDNQNKSRYKDSKLPLKISFYLFLSVCLILIIASICYLISNNDQSTIGHFIVYILLCFIALTIIGVIAIKNIYKSKNGPIKIATLIIALVLVFLSIIIFAYYKSGDYVIFLKNWCDAYKEGSILDALGQITTVSNYTPLYNYFLIFFARVGLYDLFAIKFLTFIFSILMSYVICKIIAHIKNSDFNYLLFVLFLLLPHILIEYTYWGQCDAIYTTFCLLSLLLALKKKSKLSFLSLGIAFALKLQFLFIVPILFVMLVIRDENGEHYLKWKDIWIAFVVYAINLLPLLAGDSLSNLLLVYFKQTGYDNRLCGNCANLCAFYPMSFLDNQIISKLILVAHIILTLTLLIIFLIFILKLSKKRVIRKDELILFATVFSFVMVFFMPKMLDRFFYIPVSLSLIYACISKEKIDKNIFTFMCTALNLTLIGYAFGGDVGHYLWTIGAITNVFALVFITVKLVKTYKKEFEINSKNVV